MQSNIIDIIGVGFNVSNIGLAISLQENNSPLSMLFLESKANSKWQEEMTIPGSDIQNAPHRDLITPVNPRSRYTFINYLFEHGRLFSHFNLGMKFPFRTEYSKYIEWCSKFFEDKVKYNEAVVSIEYTGDFENEEPIFKVTTSTGDTYLCKKVVLGHGRSINIPEEFSGISNGRATHLTKYRSYISKIESGDEDTFCVVGSSQSAIEIVLDLKSRFPNAKITNLIRSFSYKLKDTSPFSYEVFYPEFIDHFYSASDSQKEKLTLHLRNSNYSSVDKDVLDGLYQSLYEDKILERERVFIRNNSKINTVVENDDSIEISYTNELLNESSSESFDHVILATGFKDLGHGDRYDTYCPLLHNVKGYINESEQGLLQINRDYSLNFAPPGKNRTYKSFYLNGLCESTHGLGDAGSISSVSIRSKVICDSLINSHEV
ncbi:SidA/IucD/PvdA family monooxygenase [Vibrio chagasii]|uniref:SidA/IucD/PvdA family monooxygenase n=1 Tax=Vibrio chagasii TaxID=170679 RepID=A0A7Y3YT98_9VIBR|nr:SidA/IucD/PvdA family monooxygenase [Vibrio chagasii]NOH35953.1 SidA/IucD/PvdA family monooxygenase [Vibrio chagasii]